MVRDYDSGLQCRVAVAMVVVLLGPAVVMIIVAIVAWQIGVFAGASGGGGGGVVQISAGIIATVVIMFLGFIGCLAYYGFVFMRFCRETLELIPRSQLSHQQQTDFTSKFRIFRLSAVLCIVLLTLSVPAEVTLLVLQAPPVSGPIVNILLSLSVLSFGAVMAWTYMLRPGSLVTAADVQHHTLHDEDADF